MSSIPFSEPIPPAHLPPVILYHRTVHPAAPPLPSSNRSQSHLLTPERPPKRHAATKALHSLSTTYAPLLLSSTDIDDNPIPSASSGSVGQEAQSVRLRRRSPSVSSADSASDFAPPSPGDARRRFGKWKRAMVEDGDGEMEEEGGNRKGAKGKAGKGKKRRRREGKLGREDLALIAEVAKGRFVEEEGAKSIDSRKEKSALETMRAGGGDGIRKFRVGGGVERER